MAGPKPVGRAAPRALNERRAAAAAGLAPWYASTPAPMPAWVPLTRLLQPRARAGELAALERRLRDERAGDVGDAERALARAVGDAKLAVAAAIPHVATCGGCASGHPLPTGQHPGGACCAGRTAELFDDLELAALAHAGTGPADLRPPSRHHPHAGCAFRGATGCSLATAHRPARCVRYFCDGLRAELHRQGQLDILEARLAALDAAMHEYRAAHGARRDRDVVAPILAAIAEHLQAGRARGAQRE